MRIGIVARQAAHGHLVERALGRDGDANATAPSSRSLTPLMFHVAIFMGDGLASHPDFHDPTSRQCQAS
jgi:hypothetical protein